MSLMIQSTKLQIIGDENISFEQLHKTISKFKREPTKLVG